jgi:uncharacterized integral membrane protein (TIGR00698 family)
MSAPTRDLVPLLRRWWLPTCVTVAAVLGARAFSDRVSSVVRLSPLAFAVLVGIALANAAVLPARAAKDIRTLGKKLLRVGVALLGFRLAIGDVTELGVVTLLAVVAVVAVTFLGTQLLASVVGLRPGFGLLLGTGYAICGASAIAAMEPNADAEPEEVAYALSLVTLCGTLSIALLPPLGRLVGLDAEAFGVFAGAAVHDVAQVIATASAFDADAVQSAAVVKLSRVVMLAPLVTLVSVHRRRQANGAVPGKDSVARPPLVPLFIAAFLLAMGLRSAELLPAGALDNLRTADGLLLAAGMFALGTGTSLRELRRLGGRPLVLGLFAWVLVAGVSLAATLLTQ